MKTTTQHLSISTENNMTRIYLAVAKDFFATPKLEKNESPSLTQEE